MTTVLLETTMGGVRIELFDAAMPGTTKNFRTLVEKGFYDGTVFHRVIAGFMIQGGDPQGTGSGGPGYTIKDELPPANRNARLDRKHPAFGKVVSGMDVVDAISTTPTDGRDRPRTPVTIRKATVVP